MTDTDMQQAAGDIGFSLGDDGIAVLTLDVPGERMNILKESFFAAAAEALDKIENDDAVKAAVIVSGKPDSFVAGADIHIIQSIETAEQAAMLCRRGHDLMNRIAGSRKPFVAAINGLCLGGGFEMALACHARILTDHPKTAVGLPEVQLGVLPGFGGTQRLPRLAALPQALDMMLTGRQVNAKKARRLGIADEVVPQALLLQVAAQRAGRLAGRDAGAQRRDRSLLSIDGWRRLLLEGNRFGRKLVFDQAHKQMMAKTHGNYPAPKRILEVVRRGLDMPLPQALDNEIQAFAELAVTPECKQLINVYFAHTALKKETFVKEGVEARPVNKVGVLGGGLMGSGIAIVSLEKAGADVRIKDVNDDGLRNSMRRAHEYYQARIKRGAIRRTDAAHKLNRLTGALDYSGLAGADLVVEAVFEDLKLKKQMVKDIESLGNEHTVFASNTSSIPLKDIARGSTRPQNIIGMHYFSPVEKMPLLEVIRHNRTSEETIATAVAFGKRQGKTVIVVKDVAGFFVNRVLFPYINEAGYMVMEGVPIDAVDKAMVKWGFPVGPFKLLDEVGVDVGAKVQQILEKAYGARMQGTGIVGKMLEAGRIGKKAKKGFYDYGKKAKGKSVDPDVYKVLGVTPGTAPDGQAIMTRCSLPLLNEAARCLDEKVIPSARDGDIGAVFGIGFPPFRGGPFRHADDLGAATVVEQLRELEKQHGERFAPAEGLVKQAEDGGRFY